MPARSQRYHDCALFRRGGSEVDSKYVVHLNAKLVSVDNGEIFYVWDGRLATRDLPMQKRKSQYIREHCEQY